MSGNSRLNNAIVAGIVASILFTFLLQPLIGIAWSFTQSSGLQIYSGLSNRIYSETALGYHHQVERNFYLLFSGALWGITLGALTFLFRGRQIATGITDFVITRIGRQTGLVLRIALVLFLTIYAAEETLEGVVILAATELNASFQQRMNILRPYISEREGQLLISKWASMENEIDYQQVSSQLEDYAAANGLKLPRVLWPDVFWFPNVWR